MTSRKYARLIASLGLVLALGLALAGPTLAQTQQQQPPEYKEVLAASRIADASARLKEFNRIKAAYPFSVMMETVESFIQNARIELAPSLDAVLELQKVFLGQGLGARRATSYLQAASQILQHPKVTSFNRAKVLDAILQYRSASEKAAKDADTFVDIPKEEERQAFALFLSNAFLIVSAKAQIFAGNAPSAVIALDAYRAAGGALDNDYYDILGDAQFRMGNEKEAYQAYLRAAVDNAKGATEKAKMLYAKLTGKEDGFDDALEAQMKKLPYEPEAYEPSADWKGKAVLAEIFTGSECPPCVGADLGFDGLIEAYPAKYLAVLEYHLPIPAPDPMMNPATKKRQAYYGVNSTPTVVIDGSNKTVGGGTRGMSGGKFMQYKAAIDPKTMEAPAVELKLSAGLSGDVVTAAFSSDITVPGTDYVVVLVQKEEVYRGSNGLPFHKMVVRDMLTIDPEKTKMATFDLAASERATDAYLTEFEKTYTRIPNFRFAQRHAVIARKGLRVVFFAQDRTSKRILNAIVADIK
ncbi:MAG: hypothetical protein PHI34_06840 [Acidobacteriota bacterium]|nr:hypothetical protein [Acidobacteriota bacterium]